MGALDRRKVELINVVKEGDYNYEQEIPLGLASIGSFLRMNGFEVSFRQYFTGKKHDVAEFEADIYGFQLNMANYQAVRSAVEKIKYRKPDAVIILGGPFLVTLAEDILKNEPLFDFIVMGEGEIATLELLKALGRGETDFSSIKGLVWRNSENVILKNEPRELIENLDELPFPARDFLENAPRDPVDNGLIESVRVVTSRGCIGRCSFCCVNLYNRVQKGKRWRGRSPEHVVDELEILNRKYGARLFNFSDSSFEDPGVSGKQRSREICEEIIRRGLQISAKIYLRCETMKTDEDIELLKLYKRAGIDVVIAGAESGSEYELRLYEKNARLEDNYRIVKILGELDLFYVMIGFIMFGPNSTRETLRSNMEFLYKFGFADNMMLVANVLMLIKSSKLYRMLKDEGRVTDPENCWEMPKYKMNDPVAERMAGHYANIFARYPITAELNKVQVNSGNLIARMNNPMNAVVFDSLKDEYLEFKDHYSKISRDFGIRQRDYFIYVLKLIEADPSPEKLSAAAEDFFVKVCGDYFIAYSNRYGAFLEKISQSGFGLSSLVFKHFFSATALEKTERIARQRRDSNVA
jgi:radical SAM superfamily enzyme YgiQ (UPF0313 family)